MRSTELLIALLPNTYVLQVHTTSRLSIRRNKEAENVVSVELVVL